MFILHLPTKNDMDKLDYLSLLNRLKTDFEVIDPYNALKAEDRRTIFLNHYSGKGNQIIAEVIRGKIGSALVD